MTEDVGDVVVKRHVLWVVLCPVVGQSPSHLRAPGFSGSLLQLSALSVFEISDPKFTFLNYLFF